MEFEYTKEITALQKKYYYHYYKKTLNLPDYKDRIESRLLEEISDSEFLNNIIKELRIDDIQNKSILIIGLGTGSVLKPLVDMGCKKIYAIEPNLDALKISHLKAELLSLDCSKLTGDIAEDMPFEENSFDFIFSRSVFEHVQDLEKSFEETIRVLKQGGISYTNCPNYNYPLEDHFKIPAFTFLGKFFTKFFTYIFRRRTRFIDTLIFTTPKRIDKLLKCKMNIMYFRICRPYSVNKDLSLKSKIKLEFYKFFQKEINMEKTQEIVIYKK